MSINQKWGLFLLITLLLGFAAVYGVYIYRGSEPNSGNIVNNTPSSENQDTKTSSENQDTKTSSENQDTETSSENQDTETSSENQDTETNTNDINSTKDYSSCLAVSEPMKELRPNYLTVMLKVKNNCDIKLEAVQFSLIAKDGEGNSVEEKTNSIYSFSSGENSFVEADFDREKDIQSVTWEIIQVTD